MRTFNQGTNIVSMFKNRRILFVLILGVCLSLVAASCNDSEETSGDSFGDFLVAAEAAAESGNLSLDDFPTGWTREIGEEDEDVDDDLDLNLSEKCEILDADTVPGEVAASESDDFSGPDDQTVSTTTTVVTSTSAAKNAIDDFTEAFALQVCKDELEAGFIKAFRDDEGIAVDVSVKDVSFPQLGDSSGAYRVNIALTDFDVELVFDLAVIQQDRMLGIVSFMSPINTNPDADEESDLAKKYAEKLKAAEATLPD